MDTITKHFERMGARVKVVERKASPIAVSRTNYKTGERKVGLLPAPRPDTSFRIDIKKDRRGSYFEVVKGDGVDLLVSDVQPDDRHLLLAVRSPAFPRQIVNGQEWPKTFASHSTYLAGHDERDWFVAAVPGSVPSVLKAKEALKPEAVVQAQVGLKTKDRNRRHNKATLRQGEWFFLPARDVNPDPKFVLYKEPIRRGSGKPHMCAELYRTKGQQVYVNFQHPNGISPGAYAKLSDSDKKLSWRVMMRDAEVYVRGAISHPDHKTLHLLFWHKVQMNTESRSAAMRNVAFLD